MSEGNEIDLPQARSSGGSAKGLEARCPVGLEDTPANDSTFQQLNWHQNGRRIEASRIHPPNATKARRTKGSPAIPSARACPAAYRFKT